MIGSLKISEILSLYSFLLSDNFAVQTPVALLSPGSWLLFLNLRIPFGFAWIPAPCALAWKVSQGSQLGKQRAYFICFWFNWVMIKLTSFLSHVSANTVFCYLIDILRNIRSCTLCFFFQFFSGSPVNSVPNIPSCPEVEVVHFICQCFVARINFSKWFYWNMKTLRETC